MGQQSRQLSPCNRVHWEVDILWFWAEKSVKDNIFFCKKSQFVFDSSLFPSQARVWCWLIPECVPSGVRLLTDCIMSYSSLTLYPFAMRERITLQIRFPGANSQHNFFAELATWDQGEKEATEFDLNYRYYNWSTYKQSMNIWSDIVSGNIRWMNKR